MNSLRLFVLTVACAALAAPFASAAAPAESALAACMAPRLSLVERRVSDEAARGLPSLISFVNRTQPIYQLRLVDAVAMIDAERARRNSASPPRRRGLGLTCRRARARRRASARVARRTTPRRRAAQPFGYLAFARLT